MVARFTRKDFLEALFSDYYKDNRGFILVKSLRRGDTKMSTRYFPNIEILAKEHYGDERDVYFGVCPRERMKPEKEHIQYVVALWADLDIGKEGHEDKKLYFEGPQQAAKAIRSFPRAPSLIVESGRGAHLYWLLKEAHPVEDPDKIEAILKNISEHLRCETDVGLDAVFRLPDTINTKVAGKPVACDVKFINTNFRYSLSDFENLGKPVVVQPQPEPQEESAAPDADAVPPPPPDSVVPPADPAGPDPSQLDESLVLDETIIDELIDDMSMTSVVDSSTAEEIAQGLEAAPMPPSGPEPVAEVLEAIEEPEEAVQPLMTSVTELSTSSVLRRLATSGAAVQVALVGSTQLITGTIVSNENGLIGVQSENDLYTIPLSSISYIKSKA